MLNHELTERLLADMPATLGRFGDMTPEDEKLCWTCTYLSHPEVPTTEDLINRRSWVDFTSAVDRVARQTPSIKRLLQQGRFTQAADEMRRLDWQRLSMYQE